MLLFIFSGQHVAASLSQRSAHVTEKKKNNCFREKEEAGVKDVDHVSVLHRHRRRRPRGVDDDDGVVENGASECAPIFKAVSKCTLSLTFTRFLKGT